MRKTVSFDSRAGNGTTRLPARVKRLLQAVVFLGVAGCSGETTAPVTPFTVTLTPQVTKTGHSVLMNGSTVYQCEFPLTISTSGGGTGKDEQYVLVGSGGTITIRRTSDGLTTKTYGALSSTFFGSTTLNSGQTGTGILVVQQAGGPFTGTLEFTYTITVRHAGESSLQDENRGTLVSLVCQ